MNSADEIIRMVIEAQVTEIESLKAEVERLRIDAERYRWMQANVKRIPPAWEVIGWDAAIDAAMQEAPRE